MVNLEAENTLNLYDYFPARYSVPGFVRCPVESSALLQIHRETDTTLFSLESSSNSNNIALPLHK